MRRTKDERQAQFLKGLSALTRRYGIQVGACGCCESPWLYNNPKIKGGHYECTDRGYRLVFVTREGR